PEVLEEPPARDSAQPGADAREAGPDGDGARPLGGREDMSEYREGGRHDQRRSDPHGGPGGDELARGAGERGQRRGAPEDDKAGVEGEATAVTVAESAGCEQQSGEHQAAGLRDPLAGDRPGGR